MINKEDFKIIEGDCVQTLKMLPDQSVQCCITSPPYYGLRDYGTAKWVGGDPNCPHYRTNKTGENCSTGHKNMSEEMQPVGDAIYKTVCPLCGAIRVDEQIGLEESPEEYVDKLVEVFREVKRVLKDDGTLWLNLGDSYAGSGGSGNQFGQLDKEGFESYKQGDRTLSKGVKPKDLIGIPWMVAFALRNDGWYLRQDIIWHKPNPMPESVKDRCTKSHEYIFLLSKSPKYYFDYEAIQEEANPKYIERYNYEFNTGKKEILGGGRPDGASNTKGMKKVHYKNLQNDGQRPNTMHELRANGEPDKVYTKTVPTKIAFGGNKYGDNNDSHFQTYSGNNWEQKVVVSEDGVEVPIRNKRDVWSVATKPYSGAHFATYPLDLIEPCVLAGSNVGDTILDPFNGSGTTGICALMHGRKYIGLELNPKYAKLSYDRFDEVFNGVKPIEDNIDGDNMFEKFNWGISDDTNIQ